MRLRKLHNARGESFDRTLLYWMGVGYTSSAGESGGDATLVGFGCHSQLSRLVTTKNFTRPSSSMASTFCV